MTYSTDSKWITNASLSIHLLEMSLVLVCINYTYLGLMGRVIDYSLQLCSQVGTHATDQEVAQHELACLLHVS